MGRRWGNQKISQLTNRRQDRNARFGSWVGRFWGKPEALVHSFLLFFLTAKSGWVEQMGQYQRLGIELLNSRALVKFKL